MDICYSYVMGMGSDILSLREKGFCVNTDGENYTVSFPADKAAEWEDFVCSHLAFEYWNEYVCGVTTVFLFHLKSGIKRLEAVNFHNTEALHLCEQLCERKFTSLKDMLLENWFYKEVLER